MPKRADMDELLTLADVCGILKMAKPTVRKLPIRYVQIGGRRRYRMKDIEEYLQENLRCPPSMARAIRLSKPRSISGCETFTEMIAREEAEKRRQKALKKSAKTSIPIPARLKGTASERALRLIETKKRKSP